MSLSNFAQATATFFVENKLVAEDDHEVIEYGMEIIIGALFGYSIVLLLGFVLDALIESVLFSIILTLVKHQAGGYHAKSRLMCNITTGSAFVISIIAFRFFSEVKPIIWFSIMIVMFGIIAGFAPCPSSQICLTESQAKRRKTKAVLYSLLVCLLTMGLFILQNQYYYYNVILISIIAINLLIGVIEKEVKNERNYEKAT